MKKIYNSVNTLRGNKMKRAVNLRLEESVIATLNHLSEELHTTKTDIVEKAIQLLSKEKKIKQNTLLQFAGTFNSNEANQMIQALADDKNTKNIDIEL
jgi:predicted DNA-binding protein